jgi:hypothetical protein
MHGRGSEQGEIVSVTRSIRKGSGVLLWGSDSGNRGSRRILSGSEAGGHSRLMVNWA